MANIDTIFMKYTYYHTYGVQIYSNNLFDYKNYTNLKFYFKK